MYTVEAGHTQARRKESLGEQDTSNEEEERWKHDTRKQDVRSLKASAPKHHTEFKGKCTQVSHSTTRSSHTARRELVSATICLGLGYTRRAVAVACSL